MSTHQPSLLPMDEAIDRAKKNRDEWIASCVESHTKECQEKIERIERNRPLIAMLDSEGFEIDNLWGAHGAEFRVKLGFFPSSGAGSRQLADKLRTIRHILGCKLGQPAKCLEDGGVAKGHIQFKLTPEDVPGCSIVYTRRLPRGAKCKVVTTRSTYRRLVCEV